MSRQSLWCLAAAVTSCVALPRDARPLVERLAICSWEDEPSNPLIEPPDGEAIIADPTVLGPSETPDGAWHLFAHALSGLRHYVSSDGVRFRLSPRDGLPGFGALRPFVTAHDGGFLLYFEQMTSLSPMTSEVRLVRAPDLTHFGDPVTVLAPTRDWEREGQTTTGNPFVTRRDGVWWLYYSAGGVLLPDTNYPEPRYVGVAAGDAPEGPFTARDAPMLAPSGADAFVNLGAGSFKVADAVLSDGAQLAFANGIYRDAAGNSRSAIQAYESTDGLHWQKLCVAPPLQPGGPAWKSAFIYGFDSVVEGGRLWLYYNAREGWVSPGRERIGRSSVPLAR